MGGYRTSQRATDRYHQVEPEHGGVRHAAARGV